MAYAITISEQRVLSQDKTYEVPYRSTSFLYSSLIRKELSLSFSELEKESFCVLKLQRFDDNEFITLDQAREFLTKYRSLTPIQHHSFLPILVWKTNYPFFWLS